MVDFIVRYDIFNLSLCSVYLQLMITLTNFTLIFNNYYTDCRLNFLMHLPSNATLQFGVFKKSVMH